MEITKQTEKEIVITMDNGEKIKITKTSEGNTYIDIDGKYDTSKECVHSINTYIADGNIFDTSLHTKNISGGLKKRAKNIKCKKDNLNFKYTSLHNGGYIVPLVSVFTSNK